MPRKPLVIENAHLFSKNFSGKEGQYNPAGRRNFCVFIDDPDLARDMEEDGWNIKWLNPKDEGAEPRAFIQVAVSYKNIPPKVVIISSRGQTVLNEDEINMLDWAEVENFDVSINPSSWEVNGNRGIKGYLKSIYATIVEDELDAKYYDIPDSALSSIVDDAV